MAENPNESKVQDREASVQRPRRNPALTPLLLTGALLLAVIACFWYLWLANRNAYADQYVQLEALEQQKKELNALLALPPCEAKAKLQPASAPAPTPAPDKPAAASGTILDLVERACVFIVAPAGGKKISTGSGFFVAPGYVATNKHVVEGGNGQVFVTSKAIGHPVKGRVVAVSQGKNMDFAIVKADIPANAQVAALPFSSKAQKTDKVGAWGYPDLVGKNDPAYARLLRGEDLEAVPELSYTEGVISAILPRQPEIIVHTAPISPGNSGGPLLNDKGEVVGINTMISLDENSYRQASLALSSADLQRFLASSGIK